MSPSAPRPRRPGLGLGPSALLVLGLSLSLGLGCSGTAPRSEAGKSLPYAPLALSLYAAGEEAPLRFVAEEFRDRSGSPVLLSSGGTAQLLARLRAEAAAPRADLLWLSRDSALILEAGLAEGLLEGPPLEVPRSSGGREGPWLLVLVRGAPNAGAARAFLSLLAERNTARVLEARFHLP